LTYNSYEPIIFSLFGGVQVTRFTVVQPEAVETGDRRLNIAEAREVFAELVNEVGYAGQRTIIMRRGKEVAAIVPMKDYDALRARSTLALTEVQQREEIIAVNGVLEGDGGPIIYGGVGS
jgi:prevent-host-death family protein